MGACKVGSCDFTLPPALPMDVTMERLFHEEDDIYRHASQAVDGRILLKISCLEPEIISCLATRMPLACECGFEV